MGGKEVILSSHWQESQDIHMQTWVQNVFAFCLSVTAGLPDTIYWLNSTRIIMQLPPTEVAGVQLGSPTAWLSLLGKLYCLLSLKLENAYLQLKLEHNFTEKAS